MLGIGAGVGEPLETLLALEGLLAAVQPFMLRQVVLVLEGLGAHLAFVRTLACKQ